MQSQLKDCDLDVLERAGVSKREYDQVMLLLSVDAQIFSESARMTDSNVLRHSLQENFVDFTRLPDKISKEAKNILYRPQRVNHLKDVYNKVASEMRNAYQRNKLENESI